MKGLIKSWFEQIENSLEKLEVEIEESEKKIKNQEERFAKLRKEYWERGKKLSVLNVENEGFEALRQETENSRGKQKELMERLSRVLSFTKALTSELRR